MSFRVESFSASSESFKCPSICLSKNYTNENYFTVIIGNNGTGKSRFVSNLVSAFIETRENKRRKILNYNLEYRMDEKKFRVERHVGIKGFKANASFEENPCFPNKIIAIATSLSDKFPSDGYGRSRDFENRLNQKEEFYTYLGTRYRVAGSSNRVLMDKAISTMLQNVNEDDNDERYREIFSYLDYEPIIRLSYRVYVPDYLKDHIKSKGFNGERLKHLLSDWSDRRGGFRSSFYQRAAESYSDSYWESLAAMYIKTLDKIDYERKRPEYSFVVNFSERNSYRSDSYSDFKQEKNYFLLEELRRFDLVKGPEISLYKKNGSEFDFHDASSGEASILSTLIGLIPNLSDNCLIVIDEPEISLHPTWQYRYIELIDKIISKFNGCHIVIATHSHFLISDLPLHRSHIVHFKNDKKNNLEVIYIDQETLGLSAEEILLNVFDMPSTRNYFLSKEVSEALELLAEGKKESVRYLKLKSNLKKYLPNLKKIDPLYDVISALVSVGR